MAQDTAAHKWPRFADLKRALDSFNAEYPRPGLPPLKLSKAYYINTDFRAGNPYPSGNCPGVYAIFTADGELVRLGKASCGSTIDRRLYDYFPWDRESEEWVPLPTYDGYDENMFIHTVGFHKTRAFEAPALEEYLIGQLNPRFNQNGRRQAREQLQLAEA